MKKLTKHLGTLLTIAFSSVAVAVFVIAVDNYTDLIDRENKTKRCLQEYGEGDLGMCMCN